MSSNYDTQMERAREHYESRLVADQTKMIADEREDDRESPTECEIIAFDQANVPERFDDSPF